MSSSAPSSPTNERSGGNDIGFSESDIVDQSTDPTKKLTQIHGGTQRDPIRDGELRN